jgi:hypothetical protein
MKRRIECSDESFSYCPKILKRPKFDKERIIRLCDDSEGDDICKSMSTLLTKRKRGKNYFSDDITGSEKDDMLTKEKDIKRCKSTPKFVFPKLDITPIHVPPFLPPWDKRPTIIDYVCVEHDHDESICNMYGCCGVDGTSYERWRANKIRPLPRTPPSYFC